MIPDRPFVGIVLMIGFCALVPLSDALAKLLGETVPLVEMMIARFAFQGVVLVPFIWGMGHSLRLSKRVFWLTALRTVFHLIGTGAMFAALRYLPLADAVAIAFVMPFVILLLGRFILNEEVGGRRLAACVVGFAGTLLVIQPSFAQVGWPALLPLLVAVSFAAYMLVGRQTAKDADPLALLAVSGIMATPFLAFASWLGADSGIGALEFRQPDGRELALLAAMGLLGTLCHLLMNWALRFTPSATLAPIQYFEIPFATLVGWLIFRDLPNGLAATGIVITVAAGLYIVFRERRHGSQAVSTA